MDSTEFAQDHGSGLSLQAGSILVGHDGSENSQHALEVAMGMAGMLQRRVEIVRAWTIETAPHGAVWESGYVASHSEVAERVRQRLATETLNLARSHPGVELGFHGVLGQAGEILVKHSSEAFMIVVGTRGRGGFGGLLLGSVSSHCVHRARCPVLVVPFRR